MRFETQNTNMRLIPLSTCMFPVWDRMFSLDDLNLQFAEVGQKKLGCFQTKFRIMQIPTQVHMCKQIFFSFFQLSYSHKLNKYINRCKCLKANINYNFLEPLISPTKLFRGNKLLFSSLETRSILHLYRFCPDYYQTQTERGPT